MSTYLTDEELPPLPEPKPDQFLEFSAEQLREAQRAAIAAYLRKHGEPVACMWRHKDTGLTRIIAKDSIATVDESKWEPVGPLFSAPQPTPQERQDAAMWNWLVNDSDGNVQDDFIHWLAGNVASRAEIEAWLRAAMSKEPGHE